MLLWDKYISYHPEIQERLDRLDERSKQKFLKKLKSEKDERNFSSILTELSFFEHFASNGFLVELEKEYFDSTGRKLTPDLTINKNGQSIIAEVIKLNPTSKDNFRNKFENSLMEALEAIQIGRWVQIDFVQEYFDVNAYDVSEIVTQVREWIMQNNAINAQLTVADNFIFRVVRIDPKVSHVCVLGNANSIDIDVRRLSSLGSGFVKKMTKYSTLIEGSNCPYIICIKIDFLAGMNKDEMFWTLYGDLLFNQHLNTYESKLNGAFYTNPDAIKFVSGVLLMLGNGIYYYHNYGQGKIIEGIKHELLGNQYFGETANRLVYLRER